MSEAHLNALLDRYLHKYTGPGTGASVPSHAATASGPTTNAAPAPALTSTQTPLDRFDGAASIAPGSSFTLNAAPLSPSSSARPSSLFHATDLSIIQTQIEQLSKKLHRVPEAVTDERQQHLMHAAAGAASFGGGNSASQYSQPRQHQPQPHQPHHSQTQQLHMHELEQSTYGASTQQQQPQPHFQQQHQAPHTITAQRSSIATSIAALSPPRSSRSIASTSGSPSIGGLPSSSPLKLRLVQAEKAATRATAQAADKDFVLTAANRELDTLRARADRDKQTLAEHEALRREHEALRASLARSEKIRREQLGYIQLLHTQIAFLQNANSNILNSPTKSQQDSPTTPSHRHHDDAARHTSPYSVAASSVADVPQSHLSQFDLVDDGHAGGGVSLSHMSHGATSFLGSPSSSRAHTFASFSPQRASIPARAMRPDTSADEEAEQVASAARIRAEDRASAKAMAHSQKQHAAAPPRPSAATHHHAPVSSSSSFAHSSRPTSAAPSEREYSGASTSASVAKSLRSSSHKKLGGPLSASSVRSVAASTRVSSSTKKPSSSSRPPQATTQLINATPLSARTSRPASATSSSHKPTRAALALRPGAARPPVRS